MKRTHKGLPLITTNTFNVMVSCIFNHLFLFLSLPIGQNMSQVHDAKKVCGPLHCTKKNILTSWTNCLRLNYIFQTFFKCHVRTKIMFTPKAGGIVFRNTSLHVDIALL